jgi:hypothetical protein
MQKHIQDMHKTATIVLVTYNDTLNFMELVRESSIMKNLDTKVVLYNKNKKLSDVWQSQISGWLGQVEEIRTDNIGMDIYGYIKYIVDNYANLPNYIFFINGGTDRSETKLKKLKYLIIHWALMDLYGYIDTGAEGIDPNFVLDKWETTNPANRNNNGSQLKPALVRPYRRWFETFVGPWYLAEKTGANYTNVFAVRRDRVLQHSLKFYVELKRQLEVGGLQSEVAHYIERVFRPLFSQEWPKCAGKIHV